MFDWLTNRGRKADHPMHSIEEAQSLLYSLSDEPPKALAEITSWLTTLTSAEGFQLKTRIAVVKLVDETGQPYEPQVNELYLTSRALKDFERLQLWQSTLEFWQRLAEAYRFCLDEIRRDPKLMQAWRDELPLLLVRMLRALANQYRVLRLRYLPAGEPLWRSLFELYRLSEDLQCDGQRVTAYEGEAVPATPRQELLRALMLDIAGPESMHPHQSELAARITSRYVDAMLIRPAPGAGCNWHVDLAQPRPPTLAARVTIPGMASRYFGAGAAIIKVRELIRRMTTEPNVKEQRFGDEYTPQQKVEVLNRLTHFWGDPPPHRRDPRYTRRVEISVTRGFADARTASPQAEYHGDTRAIDSMDAQLRIKLGFGAVMAKIPWEKWYQQDAGTWDMGIEIPRMNEAGVRIGTLLALQDDEHPCWIGVVRRLFRDQEQRLYAGVELLAKKPQTAILRRVAPPHAAVSAFLNAILLVETAQATQRHEALFPRGDFMAGFVYQAMTGDGNQRVKAEELLEQGEDFDRVRLTWIEPAQAGN